MTSLVEIVQALAAHDNLVSAPSELPAITGLSDDSREVRPGYLFCAHAGTVSDGHRFVGDAVDRGAAAVLVAREVPAAVPRIVVRESRDAVTVAAAAWYGHPAGSLRFVAVTGTNGKTTSVSLVRHLLNDEGVVGRIGTLGAVDGLDRGVPGHHHLTTPGAVALQAVLAHLRNAGVRDVVMEASSHALDQGRLAGLSLDAALFTNLTHEHLDYHGSLDRYRSSKLRLLDLLTADGVAVLNADAPAWANVQPSGARRTVRFGRTGDVRVAPLRADALGTEIELVCESRRLQARVPLPGAFNVDNAAGAMATAWALGVPLDHVVERLASAPQVLGRMERLVERESTVVLRDYAHTPDALRRLLEALRPVTSGRLIVLFGAGGDRDRTKRPEMGAIAERMADAVVLTSDNPRHEDGDAILDDIERGMRGSGHRRVVDREEAILETLAQLADGDCLVLAGKGHETYQIIGDERTPFDERAIVRGYFGLSQ